jgi:hypothetical protein
MSSNFISNSLGGITSANSLRSNSFSGSISFRVF